MNAVFTRASQRLSPPGASSLSPRGCTALEVAAQSNGQMLNYATVAGCRATTPTAVGDVLLEDLLGEAGNDVVATRSMHSIDDPTG